MAKVVNISIPDDAWQASETSLHLTCYVNGVQHHFEAIEVHTVTRDGVEYQAVVDERNAYTFDAMSEIDPSRGPLATLVIAGRRYVVNMIPGSR